MWLSPRNSYKQLPRWNCERPTGGMISEISISRSAAINYDERWGDDGDVDANTNDDEIPHLTVCLSVCLRCLVSTIILSVKRALYATWNGQSSPVCSLITVFTVPRSVWSCFHEIRKLLTTCSSRCGRQSRQWLSLCVRAMLMFFVRLFNVSFWQLPAHLQRVICSLLNLFEGIRMSVSNLKVAQLQQFPELLNA